MENRVFSYKHLTLRGRAVLEAEINLLYGVHVDSYPSYLIKSNLECFGSEDVSLLI